MQSKLYLKNQSFVLFLHYCTCPAGMHIQNIVSNSIDIKQIGIFSVNPPLTVSAEILISPPSISDEFQLQLDL